MTKYKIINGEPIEIIPDPDQTPGIMDTLQPGAIPDEPENPEPPEPIEPVEPETLLEALEGDVKKIIISEGLQEEKEIDEMLEDREEDEGEDEGIIDGDKDESSPDGPNKPKKRRRKRQG